MQRFTISTSNFLSLAKSFCSIDKLFPQKRLWAEDVEAYIKQPVNACSFHDHYLGNVIVFRSLCRKCFPRSQVLGFLVCNFA